jgi:PIN domain nuclease of toxin-antitoxin system
LVVCDTCVLLFDALEPHRIPSRARAVLEEADRAGELACSDVTFWEVATLVANQRLTPPAPLQEFLQNLVSLREVAVLPVTPEIASRAVTLGLHRDPADRLIAATAAVHGARLLTADDRLRQVPGVEVVW